MSIYFHRSSNLKVDVDLSDWEARAETSVCQACASEGQAGKHHVASELLETSMRRFRSLGVSGVAASLAELLKLIALTVSPSPTPSFVSLACLSINANFAHYDLRWEENLLNFQEFRNILFAAPNLAVLQLADAVIPCSEIMDLEEAECIELPSLMRLRLGGPYNEPGLYSTGVLAALKAPRLRCLDFGYSFPEDDVDQLHYAFFKKDHTPRFPSVQELSLGTFGGAEDDITFFDVVVKAFPNVTDVTLKSTDIGQLGAALDRAIQPSEGGCALDPWPCLQHLSLYRPSDDDLPVICTWLKWRSARIREARRLSVKVRGPLQGDCKQDVSCLKEMEGYGDLVLEKIELKQL
ncbi:hypothetical protein BJ138DRAFT_1117956 [Hygrophoropsis aurantiaca]|uniref:Uncharacterized protein n=1 Tax=Hygrophoropsis aurantiaca TaxID=72124 RepID=A0ACB7ZZ24_9AGAM|nr:hypothetical protein BJ138DRAFT_1117956 [Hygrophoropsis aurantiaca]